VRVRFPVCVLPERGSYLSRGSAPAASSLTYDVGMQTSGADATSSAVLDAESARWVRRLGTPGPECDAATVELHALLLGFARSQASRRAARFRVAGPEVDDIAHQATADALLAISAKLSQFRGESRFSTWAFKFVLLEVSSKLGRHFWRDAAPVYDAEEWDRLPDRLGLDPARESEWRDLMSGLRKAIETTLTDHQRRLFVAIVLNQVPLDALAAQLDTNRNAIYKSLFDARRKLRAALVANGYLSDIPGGQR
jgi:RNA polymerase sigma-70 factor, ECF subfamily